MKKTSWAIITIGILLWTAGVQAQQTNQLNRPPLTRPAPAVAEDCVSFNPAAATVANVNNNWTIVDAGHGLFSFGSNQAEARQALAIVKNYGMNQSCFVGRPQPTFSYLLVSGRAPSGSMAREDCLSFNPAAAAVSFIQNDWKIVDGNQWMFSFGAKEAEARQALAIIKKYNFNSSCFVGRPNPSFTYMKAVSGAAAPASPSGLTSNSQTTVQPAGPVTGSAAGTAVVVGSPAGNQPAAQVSGNQPVRPVTGTAVGTPVVTGTPAGNKPDLKVTKVWLAQYVQNVTQYTPLASAPLPGQQVYIVCEFENAGGAFKGSYRVAYLVNGVQVATTTFTDMTAGQKRNPAGRYTVAVNPGNHTVECVLDADGKIDESNEQNNRASIPFAVAHAATAAPALISVKPVAAYPGTTLTVDTGLGDVQNWTAVVELTTGEKFEMKPTPTNIARQFTIKAPMIYTGLNVTEKTAEHRGKVQNVKSLYLKKGSDVTNKLPFQILSPYAILEPLKNPTVYTYNTVTMVGGNWDMNLIYAPMAYMGIFEYAQGKTIKVPLNKPTGAAPPVPIPLAPPTFTFGGSFNVTIPDVYCGIPKSEQDAISKYKGKFHIEGPPGLNQPSNSIDVQIAKRPLQATNPYRTILGPFYDPKAPNATVAYRGSTLVLLPCKVEKAVITGVKNASNFPIRLSASGNAMSSGIGLSGGASTSAFNDKEMSVQWEAIGPQSDRSHSQMIILEVSWKETAR